MAKAHDETTCSRCGAPMTCRPAGDCWCMALPPRLPVPEAAEGCLCPRCLDAAAPAKPAE